MIEQNVVIDHRIGRAIVTLTSDTGSVDDLVELADRLEDRPDITTISRMTYEAAPEPPPME